MSDCEHELEPPQLKKYQWGLCLMWYCKKCEHGWGTSKLDVTSFPNKQTQGLWDKEGIVI